MIFYATVLGVCKISQYLSAFHVEDSKAVCWMRVENEGPNNHSNCQQTYFLGEPVKLGLYVVA
jgi:hypothetical protein